MMAADDWQGLGLHHWSMLALLYGTVPPVSLNENLPSLDVDKRLGIVAQILGLSEATPERKICGPGETGPVIINGRLINKMRDEAYGRVQIRV
jgi:hypothetical protein